MYCRKELSEDVIISKLNVEDDYMVPNYTDDNKVITGEKQGEVTLDM
ncbi:MAG: hypothetical protein ACXAEU_26325 [Candidatus Hodarchaeales archaeon]